MAKFLIVEARFYDHLNDLLIEGAKAALDEDGHRYEVVTVPGALEIPGAVAMAAETGRYDGFVAIGCVIRGETDKLPVSDPICEAFNPSWNRMT